MKALTIWQPWAWCIIHAGKDIENRSWATKSIGPLAIHAGTNRNRRYFEDARRWIKATCGVDVPDFDQLQRGAVIGVEIGRASCRERV